MSLSSSSSKSNVSIMDDISSLREEFYSSVKKNIFFTSSQKKECADFITSKISIQDLIKNTVYIIRDNIVYLDYSLFKQFASPSNYDTILQHIFHCIHTVIDKYGNFELHLYLATFSISAAERYKEFIQKFYRIYFQPNMDYGQVMNSMHIYFVPSMMNTISNVLRSYMSENMIARNFLRDKIFMYKKDESIPKLTELFGKRTMNKSYEETDEDDT